MDEPQPSMPLSRPSHVDLPDEIWASSPVEVQQLLARLPTESFTQASLDKGRNAEEHPAASDQKKKGGTGRRGKKRRKKVDLPGLDSILDAGLLQPLTEGGHREVKEALHYLADPPRSRCSNERASKLLGVPLEPKRSGRGKRGHGRRATSDFPGARRVVVAHQTLQPGCVCPGCASGKVYPRRKESTNLLRIEGLPPLQATVYELQQFRCNVCGERFTATAPDGVSEEKFDKSVPAMLALLRYGLGMPFKRIATMQNALGVPITPSVQWNLVSQAADELMPVYNTLTEEAAQADLNHADDTTAKILGGVERADPSRTGVFTTNILARGEKADVSLYMTGPNHAGENRAEVLKHRVPDMGEVMAMGDALSRNIPKLKEPIKIIELNCLSHARGNVANLVETNPEECRRVLTDLGKVYHHDEQARERCLTPEERLKHHQEHSKPVMDDLKAWMETELLVGQKFEPNSRFGKAVKYFLKHWDKLTQFLVRPGAPLDNNICERAIKKAVLHRKNSLYYRTAKGARVGDIFMSLIHTCELRGVNAFDYVLTLLRHSGEVSRDPRAWLPWTYHDTLARRSP